MSYTNYYYAIMQDIQTLLRVEFPNNQILIGERLTIEQQPTIIIEPYAKEIDTQIQNAKKIFIFEIIIRCYGWELNDEDSARKLTDLSEQVEELLIDNKNYPSDSSSWYNSNPLKIDYGQINKSGSLLRTSEIRWRFQKIVNRT